MSDLGSSAHIIDSIERILRENEEVMFSDIDPWTNRPYESAGPSNAGSQFPANPGPTGGASVPSNSAFGGRGTSASRNRYGLGDFRNYRSTAPVNVESDEELDTGPGAPASARFA